jgi:ankyrin repeat protein
VEASDREGLTSIMFAAQNGHDDIVRILMERGADPNAVSIRGMTAVSLARKGGHEQAASLLLGGYALPTLGQ